MFGYKFGLWALVGLLVILNVLFWTAHHHKPARQTKSPQTIKMTYDADQVPVQGNLIIRLAGKGDGQSQKFGAKAEWHAYWNFICDDERGGNFKLSAYTPGGTLSGKTVNQSGISGYGDAVYDDSGQFTLKVQASAICTWKISVKKLPN